MQPKEIKKGVYWVGAVDWNVRNFHGHTYTTRRGTTYNSYLITDEKNCLIDSVHAPFTDKLLENIRQAVALEKIDYIVVNHVETDHSGALPKLMQLCPKAKLFGTKMCREGLSKHYYGNWDFQVVKTGEVLNLGKRSIVFMEAPMLHWPDSMFSYLKEEALLFPNDAFGQHYACSERFDDEVEESVLMEEAKKYYANILWPLSALVSRKIDEVKKAGLAIDMIAPSHGIIWRKDPMKIIKAYEGWAKQEALDKAVIVYESMWGSTEKMARRIAEGLVDRGMPTKLFDINSSDRTDVVTEMLDARLFVIGSSTHDNDMLLNIASFMELLKGLKPKNRRAAVFGSYGWAGGAVKEIENVLKESGIEDIREPLSVKYVPSAQELQKCYDFGKGLVEGLR